MIFFIKSLLDKYDEDSFKLHILELEFELFEDMPFLGFVFILVFAFDFDFAFDFGLNKEFINDLFLDEFLKLI
jgi:hypothetical protein